jgi:hypothetical protein
MENLKPGDTMPDSTKFAVARDQCAPKTMTEVGTFWRLTAGAGAGPGAAAGVGGSRGRSCRDQCRQRRRRRGHRHRRYHGHHTVTILIVAVPVIAYHFAASMMVNGRNVRAGSAVSSEPTVQDLSG